MAEVQVHSGTTRLSGASTYDGDTRVIGGTLVVANATDSSTGSGAVDVLAGAALAGNGVLASPATIESSDILSPCEGIGTLTTGDLTLAATSTLRIELDPVQDAT